MNKQEYLLAIDQEIQKADSIVILRHELPDPDAIGSQIALKKLIIILIEMFMEKFHTLIQLLVVQVRFYVNLSLAKIHLGK